MGRPGPASGVRPRGEAPRPVRHELVRGYRVTRASIGRAVTDPPTPAPPVLSAPPFVLRSFRDDDLAFVREAALDAHIPRITTLPPAADDEQARAWIARQHRRVADGVGHPFVIAEEDTGTPVGQIGLWLHHVGPGRASVGYWVLARHRRRAAARTALRALSAWGLALPGVERLELYVEPWNEGSWRTAESAGYRREGLLRSWQQIGGRRRDMFMYSRLAGDGS